MNLFNLFNQCINQSYTRVENDGDYAVKRVRNTLYIYLDWSNGALDWWHNLSFFAKPYKKMGTRVWFAHGGFLKVWKSVKKYLKEYINDPTVKKIVIVGYSHGAALAVLCHEYAWFVRPDIRENIVGYGFGCPRVLWGPRSKKIKERWKNFTVVKNIDDAVTHVPPAVFGFSHAGRLVKIGKKKKYSKIDAHRSENIIKELKEVTK